MQSAFIGGLQADLGGTARLVEQRLDQALAVLRGDAGVPQLHGPGKGVQFAVRFVDQQRLARGHRVRLETPGGGGYGDVAARRAIQLGYEEADIVEVTSGLEEDDRVIVVGQDGLSDGTPIQILEGPGAEKVAPRRARQGGPGEGGPGERQVAAGQGGSQS